MKILFVASFGGHFIQLKHLYEKIKKAVDQDVVYAFAVTERDVKLEEEMAYYFPNVHRKSSICKIISSVWKAFGILSKVKPDVVISTGALPGLIMCCVAKIMGKRTIWVDSMANCQKLSFSGGIAKYVCDICLTQWEDVSKKNKRVQYWGKVL
ncbi:oligosaccharide biosynthesis protein Alg14 [Halomonas sp. 86]|uniref:oligosaccharide biosynthesis protein Alg14 n=1 Tax=unclassified Halomonas TaxID=2609666 RepID=UPI0040333A84